MDTSGSRREGSGRASAWAERIACGRLLDPILLAGVGALTIVVLGAIGAERAWHGGPTLGHFDLDAEHSVPALASALLLAAAAAANGLAGAALAGGRRMAWFAVAALLAFMGYDEWFVVHERLEERAGVDWDVLYLPLMLVAGVAWLLVLQQIRPLRGAARLWLAAAIAWSSTIVLEVVEWRTVDPAETSDRPGGAYQPLMVGEEVLEMAGTLLFGLAAVVAVRATVRARRHEIAFVGEMRPG